MAKKKKKCPKCKKGAPGWMVTFGDMMALLLTFFVLLLSFAQLDIVKFEKAAGSLKDAFGVQRMTITNTNPTGDTFIAPEFNQELVLVNLKDQLKEITQPLIDNGEAEVVEGDEGFVVRVTNDALFTTGDQVKVKPEMEPMLMSLSNLLMEKRNLIHISGHTDNRPADPDSPFPTNWSLSAAQAAAVVNFLTNIGGLPPTRMEARGHGEYQPVESNTTEAGRKQNRRIEILVSRLTEPLIQNEFLQDTQVVNTTITR